ncbi:TlpA family protein disulfide reductase [Nostoc ellipsosporum NOK]|nr:TlpA family protein disulfide reductase [Nostoc ellipsosporum NOK]
MKRTLLILLLFGSFRLSAQKDLFHPQLELLNTVTDSIQFTDYLLNEPTDKNFNGKFKVLEFWATWCRPCLKAVPHINKMKRQFEGRHVVFLSVTNERPVKAITAFKKNKFETIVVSDTTRSIQRKLLIEIEGTMPIPRTVLIDDRNRIVWYGSPEKLTVELMEKFLRKEL